MSLISETLNHGWIVSWMWLFLKKSVVSWVCYIKNNYTLFPYTYSFLFSVSCLIIWQKISSRRISCKKKKEYNIHINRTVQQQQILRILFHNKENELTSFCQQICKIQIRLRVTNVLFVGFIRHVKVTEMFYISTVLEKKINAREALRKR